MLASGLPPADSGVTIRPSAEVSVAVKYGVSVLKLLDMLEDLDDTQDTYSNADIPAESFEQL